AARAVYAPGVPAAHRGEHGSSAGGDALAAAGPSRAARPPQALAAAPRPPPPRQPPPPLGPPRAGRRCHRVVGPARRVAAQSTGPEENRLHISRRGTAPSPERNAREDGRAARREPNAREIRGLSGRTNRQRAGPLP